MKKTIIGLMLAAPLFMGMGLTSCSSDEPIAAGQTAPNERIVEVTFDAELPAGTRTTFTPDADILKFAWEAEDEIRAVNAETGKYLGSLKVDEVKADPRKCSFKGQLSVPAGQLTINFYYHGKHEMQKEVEGNDLIAKDMTIDFADQDGKWESFAGDDILIATKSFEDVKDGNLGVLDFSRHFAFGRFILKYNGEEIDLTGKTVTLSAAEGKLYNTATLNHTTAEYTYTEGDINVTPGHNDFYVKLFPADVQIQFTVRMGDDEEFNGVKGGKFEAALYYTANTEGDPIVVEMKHVDGRDDEQAFKLIYDPNYTGLAQRPFTWRAVGQHTYKVKPYDDYNFNEWYAAREGWEIIGWNTEADGSGTAYAPGDEVTIAWPETTVTLYAQWGAKTWTWEVRWFDRDYYDNKKELIKTYIVSHPAPETPFRRSLEAEFPAEPTREGYEFAGWVCLGEKITSDHQFEFTEEYEYLNICASWVEKPKPTVTTPGYGPGEF